MNQLPPVPRSDALEGKKLHRVLLSWLNTTRDVINKISVVATGEPLFTASPAATIQNVDITHWNTAYAAEHPAVTITGDGLELIGQQLQLTNPLQKLSGGRLILGDLSFVNIAGTVYIQRTPDGGITWTDTGTTLP